MFINALALFWNNISVLSENMLQIWKLPYSIKVSYTHTNHIENRKWGLILHSCVHAQKNMDVSPCSKTFESKTRQYRAKLVQRRKRKIIKGFGFHGQMLIASGRLLWIAFIRICPPASVPNVLLWKIFFQQQMEMKENIRLTLWQKVCFS